MAFKHQHRGDVSMPIRPRLLAACLGRALYATVLPGSAALAEEPQETPPSPAPADERAAAEADATRLGGITVTAQSRAQEMQEVPIPLQIVTARDIATLEATDLSRMSLFVPGLVVGGDQPTQPSYQLRGITTGDFGIGTDPAVGVYIDGVYAARSGGALLAFNDVKRVEVLKGPQGTLFGRNAAAGAISIVTNEPSDRLEARARVRLGDYGRRYGDALLNLPAGPDMAFRLSVLDNQSDGWIKDAASGKRYFADDDWGTRAAWRWNLGTGTRLLLSWDHEKLDQPPRPAIGLVAMPADPQARPPFPADPSTYLDPRHAPLYNDAVGGAERRRFDGVTLSIEHAFDAATLTSTTAWRDFDTFNRGDYDGTNHPVTYLDTTNIEANHSWYHEFKLAGDTPLADWLAGASYYRENARQTSQTNITTDSVDTLLRNVQGVGTPLADISAALAQAGVPFTLLGLPWREQIANQGRYEALALYGDVIWHLGERWNLTTGVRFTRDEKRFSWFNAPRQAAGFDATVQALREAGILDMFPPEVQGLLAALGGNLIFTDAVGIPVRFDNRWDDTSPRVVLDYRITPDVMAYASVAKGYKAGGYNSVQVGSLFQPEKVWNYEAGVKTVFPEHDLLLNASVYHYDYSNRQSLTLDPNSAGSGVPRYLVSSSDQEADGLEIEAQWRPVEDLRLNLTGAYIDSTYRHTIAPSGANLTGQPTGEPRFSFAAGLAWVWRGVAGGNLELDLSHAYRGRSRCNDDSLLQGTCGLGANVPVGAAQQRTDVRLDWTSGDGRWGAALFVNNVFDKRYVTGIGNISATVFGTPYASISPPRMVGVELRAGF
jgi:iron complex outermembrane receptor protein